MSATVTNEAPKDTGGSAFPVQRVEAYGYVSQYEEPGMSLRDYFAAMALQAIVAKAPFTSDQSDIPETMARARGAYDYADAMLRVRRGE